MIQSFRLILHFLWHCLIPPRFFLTLLEILFSVNPSAECGHVTINWRFTTEDARIKLKRLYPLIEN